jgi:hypothetical protein
MDYMGKLRSIIDALPLDQETPNTAPDLEWLRLATDVMTVEIGATVKAGGREWVLEGEPVRDHHDPRAQYAPTHRVWFTDVASPALADCRLMNSHNYDDVVAHIQMTGTGRRGYAKASRATWAKAFREGTYSFDRPVSRDFQPASAKSWQTPQGRE